MSVSHDESSTEFLAALINEDDGSHDEAGGAAPKETSTEISSDTPIPTPCCAECSFVEPGLIKATTAGGHGRLLCRECHVYEAPDLYAEGFVLAWLPDYSRSGLSLLVKLWPTAQKIGLEYEVATQAYRKATPEGSEHRDIRKLSTFFIPSKDVSHDKETQLAEAMIVSVDKGFKPFIVEISEGITAASDIFGNASFKEIHAALPHLADEDRNRLLFGLRYIPKQINVKRLKTFETKWFKDSLYRELVNEINNRIPKAAKPDAGDTETGGGHTDTPSIENDNSQPTTQLAASEAVDLDQATQKPGQEPNRRHWIKRLIGWGE
jgi:hypothetical protein